MNRFFAATVLISIVLACGNDLNDCNQTFKTVGAFTEDEKVEGITYKIIPGNVIWSVILIESVVVPVYFVGFSLWEPVAADCSRVLPPHRPPMPR